MNRLAILVRRLVTAFMLVVTLACGVVLGLAKMGVDLPPPLNTPKISAGIDSAGMRAKEIKKSIGSRLESLFHKQQEEETHEAPRKVVVTSPKAMDVTITQRYVCQIHSRQHINVCALDNGYLEAIKIQEGEAVKKGELMFQLRPVLYETKYKAENAEARLAELEWKNTDALFRKRNPVVSENEVKLYEAKKDRAKSKAEQAKAELGFTKVVAPFDGVVDRQYVQLGSLVKEGEILTTLSDNSVMWVYFNVREAEYLEFKGRRDPHATSWKPSPKDDTQLELELANHNIFLDNEKRPQHPTLVTVTGQFNNQTGTIPFRADFPNPDGVLRHGQTGTILIHRTLKNSLVIPQRATFDLLDKRYVWVVGKDDVAHQRLIATSKNELEDIFIIDSGLNVDDKIVLEGVRQVEEGGKVEYEVRTPEKALQNQKFHAE